MNGTLKTSTGLLSSDLEDWAHSTYRMSGNAQLTDAEREMVNLAADILKRTANMVWDRALAEMNRAPLVLPE